MTSKVRFLRSEGIDLYAIFIPNMAIFQLTFTEEKLYPPSMPNTQPAVMSRLGVFAE
jgi:hypothetical protein